jgi:peptide deformylase
MVKDILQIGDKRLLAASKPVDAASKATKKLIRDLLDTAGQAGLNSVGLSAVQIGRLDRVFVCRRLDLDDDPERAEWNVFINPEVTVVDEKASEMWEGCLSIGTGKNQLFAPVQRPRGIKLDFQNEKGELQSITVYDYMSHVIQHEIDHLNGVLFLSRVGKTEVIWRSEELDKYLDKHGEYPTRSTPLD